MLLLLANVCTFFHDVQNVPAPVLRALRAPLVLNLFRRARIFCPLNRDPPEEGTNDSVIHGAYVPKVRYSFSRHRDWQVAYVNDFDGYTCLAPHTLRKRLTSTTIISSLPVTLMLIALVVCGGVVQRACLIRQAGMLLLSLHRLVIFFQWQLGYILGGVQVGSGNSKCPHSCNLSAIL